VRIQPAWGTGGEVAESAWHGGDQGQCLRAAGWGLASRWVTPELVGFKPSCNIADGYCGIETKAVTSAVTRATNSKFSGARALLSLKCSYGCIEPKAVTILRTANAKMADNGVGMLSSH